MNGNVGALLVKGYFEFLDEQALPADGGEAPILNAIALRHHGHQRDLETRMRPAQKRGDMFGLPQGKLALAGGDPQRRAMARIHCGFGLSAGNSLDFRR